MGRVTYYSMNTERDEGNMAKKDVNIKSAPMSAASVDLAIRGENVQRLYGWYKNDRFEVNRRYQRKLVWTVAEKRAFIDSLLKGFPVPLILIAEYEREDGTRFEIIDGMQRLNAVFSFIEQDFDIDGSYFDLATMAETKELLDTKLIEQKKPQLDRKLCVQLASYPLPMSVYRIDREDDVDDVFRRINSNGRHLSRQEIRIAGNTGRFANLVRRLASNIRGDSSLSDILPLSKMKLLSISNKDLSYGLDVDKIFWVEHGIITKDQLRESTDEELVSDTLAYILLDPKPASSYEILNGLYGLRVSDKENSRADDLELAIIRVGEDAISRQYLAVYNVLKKCILESGKRFNTLMFKDAGPRVPRYFQVIFLALHHLMVVEDKVPKSAKALCQSMDGIGGKIKIAEGGRWSARDRAQNVGAAVGMLSDAFKRRSSKDPALSSWATELENLLMQSTTEQGAFDFKQGFHRLVKDNGFDSNVAAKIVKTLAAMANDGPESVGYVLVGIADDRKDAETIERIYGTKSKIYGGFFISGVEGEIAKNYANSDIYLKKVVSEIKKQRAPSEFISSIVRNIQLIKYHGKSVLIFKIYNIDTPIDFEEKFYERHGNEVVEIKGQSLSSLFKRFKS